MVAITEELVRKKSEHNECEISTLEELSLHQEDIEKIEHLQNWCRNLEILLLQSNLISKIENLHKLKRLKYLNLALNNIEVIENLEGCESLEKLDLTVNFIGDLKSVCELQKNIHLKTLYLTGNPCTDYENYRSFVIAKLPQLEYLDDSDIKRSERIKAIQDLKEIENNIAVDQKVYELKRDEQKKKFSTCSKDELSDEQFWKETSEHCPEVRYEIAKRIKKSKTKQTDNDENEKSKTRITNFFARNGRPYNINQPRLNFKLDDLGDPEFINLELEIFKHLDTNLIEIDLQPTYVRVSIKGKVFQFVLPEEIITNESVAQRSQTTGHLCMRMKRLKIKECLFKKEKPTLPLYNEPKESEKKMRREYLEIGPDKSRLTQLCQIMDTIEEPSVAESDVPPLE